MRLARNPKLMMDNGDDAPVDLRRHGRLRCEQARCCIGLVVDLSASGMLVQHRGRLAIESGQELTITVSHESDESKLTVKVRVIRIERTGFRKHLYGLEFIDLDDEHKRQLSALARMASDQLIFRCKRN